MSVRRGRNASVICSMSDQHAELSGSQSVVTSEAPMNSKCNLALCRKQEASLTGLQKKIARAANGLTAETATIQTFAGGSAFKRHHNPRGEVEQLDGLSVGDADDSDCLDDAFAGAAFKKHANAARDADADLAFFCSTVAFARSPGSMANVGLGGKHFCQNSFSSFD